MYLINLQEATADEDVEFDEEEEVIPEETE